MFVMRLFGRVCAAILICTFVPLHAQEILTLQLDRARILEMPQGTHTLVIGNPSVADVTFLKRQNQLVINARAFGETNMIALDAQGAALAEMIIRVRSGDHTLIIQRGMERESWSCNPRCEPTVELGDSGRHTSDTISQSVRRNDFARPQSTNSTPANHAAPAAASN